MYWIYDTFKTYCERTGVQVDRDDLRFIERLLYKIPVDRRKYLMKDYISVWQSQENQNQGRFAANTFLREATDEY